MKKPEIVATLGYSFIKNSELIEKLLQEGVFNFRFNLCKGEDVSLLKQKIELIRDVEKKYDYPINIMLDIPFPGKKPRIFLENTDKIHVEKGEHLLITSPSVEPKNK